jgi:hypothetical protein
MGVWSGPTLLTGAGEDVGTVFIQAYFLRIEPYHGRSADIRLEFGLRGNRQLVRAFAAACIRAINSKENELTNASGYP